MRRLLFFSLLLLLGIKYSYGQDYFKLLRPNVFWDVQYMARDQFCYISSILKFYLNGEDTIINDKVYQEMVFQEYRSTGDICFPYDRYLDPIKHHWSYLREDTLLKRIFIYVCDERLLYDFSLQVNDSLKMYANLWNACPKEDSISINVDEISQFTLLDGRIVKRLDNTSYYLSINPFTILEGIGNLYDPFNFIQYATYNFEWGSELECVTDNGIVIYGSRIVTSISNDKSPDQFEVFPNPANEYVNVRFNRIIDPKSIKIVDALGICYHPRVNIIEDDLIRFSIEEVPSGIYFIIIPNETNSNCAFIKF